MIDVSEVINDPDFCQSFTILRSTGSFVNGVWVEGTPQQVQSAGVISVASVKDIRQLPEGDQISAAMVFHSTDPIYTTRAGQTPGTSDILVWNGENYRVMQVAPYSDWGYYKAIAVRMVGN